MADIKISKQELYEKVWSMPMQKVADHYDCDCSRLRSSCLSWNIPVPPKGYWMKVQFGKALPERPPLNASQSEVVFLRVGNAKDRAAGKETAERANARAIRDICKVPKRITNPHPAIVEIMSDRIRWSKSPQMDVILKAPPSDCVKRGFLISDVIAKAVEAHGFAVTPERRGGLIISSEYRKTRLRVRERLEISKQSRGVLLPTGFLEVQVDGGRWAFEPRDDLERNLPYLLARFLHQRDDDANTSVVAAERERLRAIEAKEREERARLEAQEGAAFAELIAMSSRWSAVSQARSFIAAIRARGPSVEHRSLIEWLHSKIESEDPLDSGPDAVLERLRKIKEGR